ncbi:MAG: hypothetical protein M1820_003022 [Bogoriella megaspora]|nr:MAG: hypothetical protein M1820_003022 [Bogoriella megaspora]
MRLGAAALLYYVSQAATSILPHPQSTLLYPSALNSVHDADFRIPTAHESAIQARRILHLEDIGTLSTVFPSSSSSDDDASFLENRPNDVSGSPIGLMDYFGDCEPSTGNPTILAISIATSFKNVAAGSNITLSLRWHPPDAHKKRYSAANLPRYSLVGYLEEIGDDEATEKGVARCFTGYHPDARAWLPGNRIHESHWVRLVVQDIYWIGGFGDRAYIGWIPIDDWRNVTMDEIASCRLPGERTSASYLARFLPW